jgi:hypothetical protein
MANYYIVQWQGQTRYEYIINISKPQGMRSTTLIFNVLCLRHDFLEYMGEIKYFNGVL